MNFIEKYREQKIDRLDVDCEIIETLKNNEITTIGDLCQKSKKDFREMAIETNDINKIYVELQLLGLNLKGAL